LKLKAYNENRTLCYSVFKDQRQRGRAAPPFSG